MQARPRQYIEVGLADYSSGPKYFGEHPQLQMAIKALRRKYTVRNTPPDRCDARHVLGLIPVPVEKFIDPRHPSVGIVPRSKPYEPIDEYGDTLFADTIDLPFSSSRFYWNDEDDWVFAELKKDPYWRLFFVNQLGFLIPPIPPSDERKYGPVHYYMPQFIHSRGHHCALCAIMADILLARSGFTKEERAAIVLTIAFHDVATPAGGDSAKRVDRIALDEERNFAYQLNRYGLPEDWSKRFGFDLHEACAWVRNEGLWGRFLDVLDKLSYVALDCFHIGRYVDGNVRRHGMTHPLFMDVWEQIAFSDDRTAFGFTEPYKLYQFLLARAYEHQDVLLHPYARAIDFHLTVVLTPLYASGEITFDDLLTWTTQDLIHFFDKRRAPGFDLGFISPRELKWKRFSSQKALEAYFASKGRKIHHIDEVPRFNPGLDWPVFTDPVNRTKVVPVRQVLHQEQIQQLEDIRRSVGGIYAYWYANPEHS